MRRRASRERLIAVRDLERLGYAQQLFREMGGFSNFAISFSIISVLTGAVLLYGYGLTLAGPIVNSVGWPVVLCGLASITSMGRMWYAFARDDGMPGARWLKRIDHRHRTPVWAIVVTTVMAVLICIYAAAYAVITSISTITLYLAYAIPIYLNWRNRRRRRGEYTTPASAPWSLGRWSPVINAIALGWVAVLTIVFSLPPNERALDDAAPRGGARHRVAHERPAEIQRAGACGIMVEITSTCL
jgi:amino acid transporter